MFLNGIRRSAMARLLGVAAATFALTIVAQGQSPAGGDAELPPVSVDVGGDDKPKGKAGSGAGSGRGGVNSIVALVNDEPITGYEIDQRASMLAGGNVQEAAKANFNALVKNPNTTKRLRAILEETVKANEGKSREEILAIFEKKKQQFGASLQQQALNQAKAAALPKVRKTALEELIDEKLKLQEAKRLNVSVGEDEVDRVIEGIAERNKMNLEQLAKQLGGSLEPMKTRIRSTLTWNEVVRRRYGAQITIANRDVDRFVAGSAGENVDEQVELQLQRIQLIIPAKLESGAIAQRVADGEQIRARHQNCSSSRTLANGVTGAKFEDLGKRKPGSIPEPTRTMLLNARDGEMLPPMVADGGVELWIVCGRDVVKVDDQRRTMATNELRQKEFELMGKRHLKDLRQDALIEYR